MAALHYHESQRFVSDPPSVSLIVTAFYYMSENQETINQKPKSVLYLFIRFCPGWFCAHYSSLTATALVSASDRKTRVVVTVSAISPVRTRFSKRLHATAAFASPDEHHRSSYGT